jgi:hypothetical protein
MNFEEFSVQYAGFKDLQKIFISCEHDLHEGNKEVEIGKQPAKRNIQKNGKFICRECSMHHDNPMTKKSENRQTNEIINVVCSDANHNGDRVRQMKKSGYFGPLTEPYTQVCGSCSQRGKIISEEQRAKISEKLTGIERSEEFKQKLSEYMKNNPEGIARGHKNLFENHCTTGMLGKHHSDETKKKMSEAISGRIYSEEHRQNISEGRKKMLEEQGGFTSEHRERISKATIKQYMNGFNPKMHHINGLHNSPKVEKGTVFFRSSYEKKAFMILDQDETVKSYQSEAFVVEYNKPNTDIKSNYIVDIFVEYIDGSKKLIEVKPEAWLKDEIIQCKLEAAKLEAKKIGIEFEIWTEMKLFGHVYNKRNMDLFIDKILSGEI